METKEKKKRTPKDANNILAGALCLSFAERVHLKNELEKSIEAELKQKEDDLKEAKEIVNGKQH